jgi:hypothetical protein
MSLDKVNNEVKAISTGFGKMVFDDAGVAIIAKDLFEKTLPEGLTMESVKAVQDHILNFSDGGTLALGEAGIEHLKAHPDLAFVTMKVKLGRDQLSGSFTRTANYRNVSTGAPIVKFGVSDTKLVIGKNSKRKDHRLVTDYLADKAVGIFSS